MKAGEERQLKQLKTEVERLNRTLARLEHELEQAYLLMAVYQEVFALFSGHPCLGENAWHTKH